MFIFGPTQDITKVQQVKISAEFVACDNSKMVFCRKCGKKESRTLSIDKFTGKCQKCAAVAAATGATHEQGEPVVIDENAKLSDIPFHQFKLWIQYVIKDTIQAELKTALEQCSKDIDTVKKDLGEEKQKVVTLTAQVNEMRTQVAELEKEQKKTKEVGEAHLKYLINLDRNARKYNIMIFGLPENDDLVIERDNEEETLRAANDDEKVSAVLSQLQSDISKTSNFHRLGKPGDNPQPVKVYFFSPSQAQLALSNSKNLNEWEARIYVKADKTKSEAEEFKRIGKRKEELLLQHPTVDPDNPIVTLAKGILKVNGTEVDRYKTPQTLF